VLRRCQGEQLVLRLRDLGIDAALVLSEALRDDVPKLVLHRVRRRREDVAVIVGLGLDEDDLGGRSHCVRPLDIEVDLARPADLVGVVRVERRRTLRRDDGQLRVRQAPDGVELSQVVGHARRGEGIDDDDGPALAGDAVVEQRLDPVGGSDLVRSVALDPAGSGVLAAEDDTAGRMRCACLDQVGMDPDGRGHPVRGRSWCSGADQHAADECGRGRAYRKRSAQS
jgi:hypothetical protein